MAIEPTYPKTTQPAAKSQRVKPATRTTAEKINKKLDAFPDKIDTRDWFYQPTLSPLPEQYINFDYSIPILDQGTEGACTGFASAAVINYHLLKNGRVSAADAKDCVSPRMLYEMARRYDEWPGEDYVGSSARGSVKGWIAHGVVKKWQWENELTGYTHLNEELSKAALEIPAGAYYRVMHRNIRDMHSAIHETGVLFATLMVHEGWIDPQSKAQAHEYIYKNKTRKKISLPVIERKNRADSGHAIAIIGYTREGFIIQNSWGEKWGYKGFALLPYEDWMLHSSDCWVVQLGVPVDTNFWGGRGNSDTDAGRQRASAIVPLESIRPYTLNIGNNGFLSESGNYWTTEEDIERLFKTIANTSKDWNKKRIMLYLHGGLNSAKEVARRIISFKQVCLDNQIYPLHIMWESDFWNSMKEKLFDLFKENDAASNSWLSKLEILPWRLKTALLS